MNKTDFIRKVAIKTDLTQKDAGQALDTILATIQETLAAGEKVQFIGFGTFEVRDRAERKIKSPATGAEMVIPATKSPAFKAGKALKEAIAPKPLKIKETPKAAPKKKAKDKKKNKIG